MTTAVACCGTCKHWEKGEQERCDGVFGKCSELTGNWAHAIAFVDGQGVSLQGIHEVPSTFGCLLHCDLAEAEA